MTHLAVWIWQRAAWFEPQSVMSQGWLNFQAVVLFILVLALVVWLLPRGRK